jgi:hypothetical protein
MGITPNMSLSGTQQERRHQLVHHNAANMATKDMTEDTHLKIVHISGSSKNKKQPAIGCKYIHIMVTDSQLIV